MADDFAAREARRDRRVTAARQSLRAARTERERADALCEELAACIDFDQEHGGALAEPAPLVAARVKLGDVTLAQTLSIVATRHTRDTSDLAVELASVLTAPDWLALEAAFPSALDLRAACAGRLAAEGDVDGALALATAEPEHAFDETLAAISPHLQPSQLAPLRARCAREIAECLGDEGRGGIDVMAPLALCLSQRQCARVAAEIAARLEALEVPSLDTHQGRHDWRVLVLRTLLVGGEFDAAESLFEWILSEPAMYTGASTPGPNCAAALALMVEHEPPEMREALEARALAAHLECAEPNFEAREMLAVLRGAARDRLVEQLRSAFDAGHREMPPQVLTRAQREVYWGETFDALTDSPGTRALRDALRDDPSRLDAVIQWSTHRFSAPLGGPGLQHPLAPLLQLAHDGCPAAAALWALASRDEALLETGGFFVGLDPLTLRSIVDGAPRRRANAPEARVDECHALFAAASAPVRAAMWAQLDLRSLSWDALDALSDLAPDDAVDAIASRVPEVALPTATEGYFFAVRDRRVRETIARWMLARHLADRGAMTRNAEQWSALARDLGEHDELARDAMVLGFGAVERAPLRALPPEMALARLRATPLDEAGRWMSCFCESPTIDRIAALDGGAATLARFADGALDALARCGWDASHPSAALSLQLVALATEEGLRPMASAQWSDDLAPLARAALLRVMALGRPAALDPVTDWIFDAYSTFDEGAPQWEFLLRACADRARVSVAQAVEETFELAWHEPLFDPSEMRLAGMSDAVLDAFAAAPPDAQLRAAGALWQQVSDAARARALPWVRRALASASLAQVPAPLAELMEPEAIAARWSEREGFTVRSLCESPAILRRMIGQDGIDRLSLAIAQSLRGLRVDA